jgi:hypothetical protein
MTSIIPSLPEIKFLKSDNNVPILNQIDDQDEEFLKSVKPCNQRIARHLICQYSMSKNSYLNNLFKKYDDDYTQLRIELQQFINARKIHIENIIKHLK